MRARLTAAFAAVGLLVVVVLVSFRAVSVGDLVEEQVRAQLDHEAAVLAAVVAARPAAAGDLAAYAAPDRRVVVTLADGTSVEAEGAGWSERESGDADEPDVVGTAAEGAVAVEVRRSGAAVAEAVAAELPSLLVLGAVLVVAATAAGALLAGWFAAPFAVLAGAAGALARGRLDLRLPRTRIPEARAIGAALAGSATGVGDSLRRERDLALRASHELRTPLTALRLELDDLRHREDVPADLADAADRCLAEIDRLDGAVGAVVDEARTRPLPGSQVALEDVARGAAYRWADALGLAGAGLEVELTGDGATPLTAGPLEQVLDDLLLEVLGHRPARARLCLDGGERHVRLTVTLDGGHDPGDPPAGTRPLARATALVGTLGGRVSGGPTAPGGLVVLLPRR